MVNAPVEHLAFHRVGSAISTCACCDRPLGDEPSVVVLIPFGVEDYCVPCFEDIRLLTFTGG